MIEVDSILHPIAGSNPCGSDLEYDSRFQAIKDLVESGSEESPTEWKKVKKLCLELLNDGRSIELLVFLAVSLVASDGYQGLRDGLHILEKSVADFWDTIYPELDLEDAESERYYMRLNSIAQLGEQPRKSGDQLGFVERILRVPLSMDHRRQAPCFWKLWLHGSGDAIDASDIATVQDHGNRMSQEERSGLAELLNQSIEHLSALGEFLIEKTGSAYNGPFDEHLLPALQQIQRYLGEHEEAPVEDTSEEMPTDALAASPAVSAAPSVSAINSTADVKKALDRIIAYYRKAEPSSPVPYMLIRAQKLIDADFMEIVKNLNQDSEHQFRTTLDITESD